MSSRPDVAIIGGGIVGLALADAWLARHPRDQVVVFDKESGLARHASGRNSGVIHAGFYYAPDSLKAQLTRVGNEQLREFCQDRGIPIRETGKVVVAQREEQIPALQQLLDRGRANGVELELIDEQQLKELEPLARTVTSALWSPNTAVADPVRVVEGLADRVRERGGHIRTGEPVVAAGSGWIRTKTSGRLSVGHIVNAAGLYADRVAHWFGVGTDYRMLPFKGLYWYANWPVGRLKRHIYPVPDPRNPFLGVHLTVTVDGRAKVGPTAIPALRREDYTVGLPSRESLEIARTLPAFLTSSQHNSWSLIRTELPKYSRRHLVRQARSLVPDIRVQDFTKRGRPGIRAQLFHLPTKSLEMDFVVQSGPGSTHVLNAVSPAWTSALAFASFVVDGIHRN